MLASTKIEITRHAMDRYRERINLDGTAADVERDVRYSTPCSRHQRNLLMRRNYVWKQVSSKRLERIMYWQKDDVFFVMEVIAAGSYRLVTVWREETAA